MRRYKDWDIWSDNKLYQLSQCMKRLRKCVKVFKFFFFSLHLLQSATSAEKMESGLTQPTYIQENKRFQIVCSLY